MLTNSWTKHELPTSTRINLLGTFAHWVRIGKYTQDGGTWVKCQTVQVALHAIRVMFELDGKPNPMYHSEGWYWLAIERQLEGYCCENPLTQAKLAVLVKQGGEPHPCHWKCKSNRKDKSHGWHVSHCILFSLASGQIHSTPKNANWHTTPFCANDITFWDKNLCVIQNDSSLNDCPMPTQQ
jgi:hypothetical protein